MSDKQTSLFSEKKYKTEDILGNIEGLLAAYKAGKLGGEHMPEDAKPSSLNSGDKDFLHYFTLPMALNYQRNSYTLWESATKMYHDSGTRWCLDPKSVYDNGEDALRQALLKHKVALQPNKHINTWFRICETLVLNYDGDIKVLLDACDNDVIEIRNILQVTHKKGFPYLSGEKISNYWLYVLGTYGQVNLKNKDKISVAPDTHIIKSSLKLGLIDGEFEDWSQKRTKLSELWVDLLKETDLSPIDIHTPMWLWSRSGFPDVF